MRECFLGLMICNEETKVERKDAFNQVVSNMKRILLQLQYSTENNSCLLLDLKYLRLKFCLDEHWQEVAMDIVKQGLEQVRYLY